MKEYVAGRSVNPLVVSRNVTDRSDLRIFSSDGNVTIKAYVILPIFAARRLTNLRLAWQIPLMYSTPNAPPSSHV